MARLRSDEITASDIKEYLEKRSDFSFELEVLKRVHSTGLSSYLHGGTYEDPITGKSREFDIRASFSRGRVSVGLSIECKNLGKHFPLVVHCVKRRRTESFNDVILSLGPPPNWRQSSVPLSTVRARVLRLGETSSFYPVGEYVAKSTDQVGRNTSGEIVASDGEVFDKISQAVNSSYNLIANVCNRPEDGRPAFITIVCPVLVIPDGTLWQVCYDDEKATVEAPTRIERIPYFIGKEWIVGDLAYNLSHLEIVTLPALEDFLSGHLAGYAQDLPADSYLKEQ